MGRGIDEKSRYKKKGFISKLPMWFKELFVRFWFAGAVFYFIGWGLIGGTRDQLDLTVVLGLVHGLVTDLAVNKIIIFMGQDAVDMRYMLCGSRRFYSVPVNIIFGIICAFLVAYTYSIVNYFAMRSGIVAEGFIFIGAEPLLYGLLYILYESIFILIKNTLRNIVAKAKGGDLHH